MSTRVNSCVQHALHSSRSTTCQSFLKLCLLVITLFSHIDTAFDTISRLARSE